MAEEKTKEKAKSKEKKRTRKVISSFAVLTIVLSVLAASVATVSAPDVQQPQPPKITKIVVTANPTSIPANGMSVSDITVSTEWVNITNPQGVFWINFEITIQPGGATLICPFPDSNNTDSAGKAYTQLIAGTNAGNVVIKASSEGAGWYIENTTTVILTGPPEIVGYAPPSPVSDNEGATRTFNITVDQVVTVNWQINGTTVQTNPSVTETSYTNTSAKVGTWNVSAIASNPNGTAMQTWIWNVRDITPPASISGLTNTTGNFWINWTWTNPLDADFNHTMVYIYGSFVTNVTKPQNWYNGTYAPHATRTISTRTVDTSGNINTTWKNQTTTVSNNLPVLEAIGPKSGLVGQPLTIDANATDSDGDVLTYSCNRTDLFTDFNPATGKGSWTPPAAGVYYVNFGVSDGYGGIDNETVQITVFGYGVNLTVEGAKYAEKTTAPSKNATYLLTVKNTGTIADTYALSVENPNGADFAVLNRTTITNLAQGATADVLLNVSDAIEGEYMVNVTAAGTGVSDKIMTKTTVSATGSVTGKITYTCNTTGIAGVTVNLTKGGSVISSTVTNATGYFNFTDVTPNSYFVNASKPRFWGNSTSVTVIAGTTTTADMMLWLKGDLNNNGMSADAGDLTLMKRASVGEIEGDWRYDLNKNGMIADAGDLTLMKRASVGEIILE